MKGGCCCGAVRYRLASAPHDAGWCHCRTCQLNSGSPAMAFATIATADFHYESGEAQVGRFASSERGRRAFCTACGTPLFMQDADHPETLDFSIATLDHPEAVRPEFHIFYRSHIAWAPTGDALPRYATFRRGHEPESN